jgi:tripartite-type tricarboxylate transporter receptor subunit TctC
MKPTMTVAAAASLTLLLAACSDNNDDSGSGEYPDKAVNWIVPFAAGGGADASFRVFQKHAEPLADDKMQITNIDGAGGVTGWTQFLNSEPDGYTLSLATPPFNVIPKVIQPDETPYELDQFNYICTFAASPDALFIKAGDDRFDDLESMLAYAKENPGNVTAGTTGAVGTDAFHMYQLQALADVEFKMVPFDSATDVSAALVSGDIDIVFSDTSWVSLGAGEMTPIAVASDGPHPDFPDIPTYQDAGIDLVSMRLRAPAAPPDTPDEVMSYWQDICEETTKDETFLAGMSEIGQPVTFYTGEETKALVEEMTANVESVVEEQGLEGVGLE